MDTEKQKITLPAEIYFDTIIYFYMLASSVHEGDDVLVFTPETFLENTKNKKEVSEARLSVNFFSDLKNAQKLFQLELADSMIEMTGMWIEQLSLDPVLYRVFNAYALEKYHLNIPIEFMGERPKLTLIFNKQE